MDALKNFLLIYANCTNFFILTFGAMLIVFILWCFFARGASCRRDLKRINRILRQEVGQDVILAIEKLRLSKRFSRMWDDYYAAYSGEDTVALHNYLLKNDLLCSASVFRTATRAIAVCGFSAAGVCVLKLSELPIGEKVNLLALFFALAAVLAVFEVLYAAISAYGRRRLVYLLEEFQMLSLRKLPGKAVDFSQQYLVERMKELEARVNAVRSGVAQLNARTDRLIHTIEQREQTEKNEEHGETL